MDSSKQAGDLEEPQTEKSATAAPFPGGFHSLDRFLSKLASCLLYISFCFMVHNFVTAIYNFKKNPANLAFFAGSYILLGLLYFSMREFDRTRGSSSRTKKFILKAIIWVLSVIFHTVCALRLTAIVDSHAFDVFVWTVMPLTSAFWFYVLLVN